MDEKNKITELEIKKNITIVRAKFSCEKINNILEEINQKIHQKSYGHYISVTNTESLYYATRIEKHLEYINKSDFSCCDGIAVVLAGKMLGYRIPRLHGPDLMLQCCKHGVKNKWRHYFYGGKKGVPEKLSRVLKQKFSGLITAGTFSPPFRNLTYEEDTEIIRKINSVSPDILWVGLGLLKQERWIARNLRKINVPWMIGVGAAFDFHAGTVKRAPKFYRNLGLEWFYRGIFEPRMIKRNFHSSLIFFSIYKEISHRKKYGNIPHMRRN